MAIIGFLIRRILTGIVVIWLVATGAFFLFFARPGGHGRPSAGRPRRHPAGHRPGDPVTSA